MVNLQVTEQSKRDLLVLEAIVVPLSFPGVDLGVRRPFRRRAPRSSSG